MKYEKIRRNLVFHLMEFSTRFLWRKNWAIRVVPTVYLNLNQLPRGSLTSKTTSQGHKLTIVIDNFKTMENQFQIMWKVFIWYLIQFGNCIFCTNPYFCFPLNQIREIFTKGTIIIARTVNDIQILPHISQLFLRFFYGIWSDEF